MPRRAVASWTVWAALGAMGLAWATPARAQNLVANPGFESGSTGWSGGVVVPDSPYAGAACLRIVDDRNDASVAASGQLIAITQGRAYRFELFLRGAVAGQQAYVTLQQHRADDSWISGNNMDFTVAVGLGWTGFRRTVRAFNPETAKILIVLRAVPWTESGEHLGTAYFDEVVFEETAVTDAVYGSWLADEGSMRLWHSPAEQKVRRDELLPDTAPWFDILRLSVAGNEAEAAQIVLLPETGDDMLRAVTVGTLAGPAGATLGADRVAVRVVEYVEVTQPTDLGSRTGWTPDPLPAFAPTQLRIGVQQPLWITVTVPAGQAAGDYAGVIALELDGAGTITLPLAVHVWGFDLPAEHHLRTAYGISWGNVFRYHAIGADAAARRLLAREYLHDFAAHRLSPQNPVAQDWYQVRFPNWNWEGGSIGPDPEAPTDPNRVLYVADDDDGRSVSTSTTVGIPITAGVDYRLTWRARTEGAHHFLAAVSQYDSLGQHIPGRNVDLVRSNTGSWATYDESLSASLFATQAATVRINLYAVPWTADGANTGNTWFDDVVFEVAASPQNLVANGDFDLAPEEIQVLVESTAFDDAMTFAMDDLGFDAFQLWLPGFAWGSYQGFNPGRLLVFDWGTTEYEELESRVVRALTDHLASRGWLERAYAYWYDEPQAGTYGDVIDGMDLLGRADSRLARLLTVVANKDPALEPYVDIWVPILDNYDPVWAAERRSAGAETWWYVCTGPRSPYPNEFIDHPGQSHRLLFWMAWRYGAQGSLYWDTTYWTEETLFPVTAQDPWTDPMSYPSGGTGFWGNGDGRLLYPPRDWQDGTPRLEGPTPSIRWELTRDGIEDYEAFWLLAAWRDSLQAEGLRPDLVAAATTLLDIPTTLFSALDDYTIEVPRIQAYREQVGNLLEQMRAALPTPPADGGGGDGAVGDGGSADGGVGTDPGGGDAAAPGGDRPGAAGEVAVSGGCACGGVSTPSLAWLVATVVVLRVRRSRRATAGRAPVLPSARG